MTNLSQELAQFIVDFDVGEIPDLVRAGTSASTSSLAGLATAGSALPLVSATLSTLSSISNREQVGLLGRRERLGLCDGPIITGVSMFSASHEFDRGEDRDWSAAPVVAAALAAGEYTAASGPDTLAAISIGVEVAVRVERAMSPALATAGWSSGAAGARLGAAAATGRLMALTVDQMVSALGLAATQAAGFEVVTGSGCSDVVHAKAAGDGVEAALLARTGFHGPATPIEGRRGLFEVLAPRQHDLLAMTDGLGTAWLGPIPADSPDLGRRLGCPQTVAAALALPTAPDLNRLYAASLEDRSA